MSSMRLKNKISVLLYIITFTSVHKKIKIRRRGTNIGEIQFCKGEH